VTRRRGQIKRSASQQKGIEMASFRSEHEKPLNLGIPSLEDLEPGRPVGAILPMSEHAQLAVRDSIELIDYLMNQESVIWN
jgi:hypothetical protein